MDTIHIENLEFHTRIGVTDDERAAPQRMTACLTLEPLTGLGNLHDDLSNTVDYHRVCLDVKKIASEGARNLVETLAEEIANSLLTAYPIKAVNVELRKYILPDTAYVAIRIRRTK